MAAIVWLRINDSSMRNVSHRGGISVAARRYGQCEHHFGVTASMAARHVINLERLWQSMALAAVARNNGAGGAINVGGVGALPPRAIIFSITLAASRGITNSALALATRRRKYRWRGIRRNIA
jgi:hypothetical protein